MSENQVCSKCNKPLMPNHRIVGFKQNGTPQLKCADGVTIEETKFLEGVNRLFDRMEAAETAASTASSSLTTTQTDHNQAITLIANLELTVKQQKSTIDKLKTDLELKESARASAADDLRELEKSMRSEIDKAQDDLARLDKSWAEKLEASEKEASKLSQKIEELTAGLAAANAKTDSYEDRAVEAEKRLVPVEKANRDLEKKIGELAGRLGEIARICKENTLTVTEVVSEQVIEESDDGDDDDDGDVVLLSQMKSPSSAPKEVPPPPPAASTAPATTAVAAAQTDLACMCCDKPASKIAQNVWKLKDGSYFPPIVSCVKIGSHVDAIYGLLDEARDDIENPPTDPSDILDAFNTINPN